ncbi:hypothetical protein WME91_49360 [Sorangium sp. So ce269]
MPGTAHEVLIVALRDRPALLSDLVERLTGRSLDAPLEVIDPTVRFTRVTEQHHDEPSREARRVRPSPC